MSTFDPNTWYILTSLQNPNNTLTAGSIPDAFNPNNPKSVYYAPTTSGSDISQQWQIYPINTSSTVAYILRNRQVGPTAYATTALTKRKCGGGNCATVPVFSTDLSSTESLWMIADWGFNDKIGLAYIYNLGNGSDMRLDQMKGNKDTSIPELVSHSDSGSKAQHWNATAVATFAASESTSFGAVPTAATSLLVQAAMSMTSTASTTLFTPSVIRPAITQTVFTTPPPMHTNAEIAQQPTGFSPTVSISVGAGISTVVFVVLSLCGLLLHRHYRKQRQRCRTPKNDWIDSAAESKDDISVLSLVDEKSIISKPNLKIDTFYELPISPTSSRAELSTSGQSAELPEHSLHHRAELDANRTIYELPARKSGAWV